MDYQVELADATELSEEARFRLLIDAITDYAIYMLDPTGIVVSWNPGAQRLKGYQKSEIIGQHFSRFYTEEDRAAGLPTLALQTALREGKYISEGWRLHRDGRRFWASVVIDPIYDATGKFLGFAKITRDLTERRLADEALKASEENFRLLIQSVTDYAIYMLDAEGHVTNWNSGAQRIKGYSASEIVGQHFSRFYSEEDRQKGEPQRGLTTALREGRFENEGWRIRKDGTRFWASIVIDPIRGDDGEIIGFAKVTRDITERKETQEALEKAREALFQSQKMEAIGRLTGGIAHDFNNLLMAVLSSLELIRRRSQNDPKIMGLIENAITGAKRGAVLTQRMLAFARRQDLRPQLIDVPALIHGMSDLLRQSLGPSVTIETRFPLSLPPIHADENQLEMALLNLAVNSRDALPDGGSIIVMARDEVVGAGQAAGLAAGHYVCLSVVDTGDGMDEATLMNAMEPFFTTKGLGKGTGLGLSMVHGLAEQSGGKLILKSQKGKGTTAELWLPVATQTEKPVASISQVEDEGIDQALRSLAILAVDDDSLILTNIAAMLDELGHRIVQARSGQEALEILDRGDVVDLVITDQAMPSMTGLQLAERIKERWSSLPIILATGYAEWPAGTTASFPKLSKPFTLQMLSEAITQTLEEQP